MEKAIITSTTEIENIVEKAVKKALDELESKNNNEQEVLDNRQAMEYLSVSRSTLQRWRNDGKLPYRKVQGKILYTKGDILNLLENAQKQS